MNSDVVIYEAPSGAIEVRLGHDTVWLRQEQMAELFGRDRTVIGRHVRNVFTDEELDEKSNVQILHIAGSDKPVRLYSLDVIISIGYRVKSKQGVYFRQWASGVLRDHLTRGYTLNRQRLEHNALELEAALQMVRRTAQGSELTNDDSRGLLDIVTRYAQTYLLLQRYDEGMLAEPPVQAGGQLPTPKDARAALVKLKTDLIGKGQATALFGQERGDALAALLGNLDQTAFGQPAYGSVESKAAHLLYFVIKNHPFVDGNKRSAAFLFVDFLHRNQRLLDTEGQPVINDIGLAALALLVAESPAASKDTMIKLIMNMLARPDPSSGAAHDTC